MLDIYGKREAYTKHMSWRPPGAGQHSFKFIARSLE